MDFLHTSDDDTITKLIENKDGATAWLTQDDADNAVGYVVGGAVPSVVYSACFVHRGNWLVGNALANLRRWADERGMTYDGIGVWSSDGVTYFDLVQVYRSQDDALRIARERGELAVWDRAESAEIQTGATPAL